MHRHANMLYLQCSSTSWSFEEPFEMLHGHALWPCRKFTIRFIQSFGEACMEGPSVRGTQQIGRLYGFSLHRRSTFFVTFLPHDHVQLRSSRSLGLLSEHSNSQTKLSVREFDKPRACVNREPVNRLFCWLARGATCHCHWFTGSRFTILLF